VGEDSLYENILFSNCIVETRVFSSQCPYYLHLFSAKMLTRPGWGRGEPIYVSASPWIKSSIGSAHNIRFTNILCHSESGAFLSSDTLGWVTGVLLDSVRIEISPWSRSTDPRDKGGEYDVRPSSGTRQVYKPEEGIAGFHLENLKGVTMTDCEVVWKGKEDWYRNAVWARGCEGMGVSVHVDVAVDVEGEVEERLRAIDVA